MAQLVIFDKDRIVARCDHAELLGLRIMAKMDELFPKQQQSQTTKEAE